MWHGRKSYSSTATLSNFVIHRGMIITVIQAIFMILINYVSLSFYNSFLRAGYTTLFTAFAVFSLILSDDIPIEQAFNYPILYSLVMEGHLLSTKMVMYWIFKSVFQGAVIILLSFTLFNVDYNQLVMITFTSLIFIEYLNIYSSVRSWSHQ